MYAEARDPQNDELESWDSESYTHDALTLYWYDGEDIVVESSATGVELARYTHGPGTTAR